MISIINIVTEKDSFRKEIDITVRPSKDAAENILEAVTEYLTDWKKDNPSTIVNKITLESEKTGKILADLKFTNE